MKIPQKNVSKIAGYTALAIGAGILTHRYISRHGGYKKVASDVLKVADTNTRRAVFHTKKTLDSVAAEIGETIHEYIPREEDLLEGGKYFGIGNNYKYPLTISRCDNCISFIERAKESIPDSETLKQTVISDIRRSASTNSSELNSFYQNIFCWQLGDIAKVRALTDCAILADQIKPVTLSGEKYS